MKRTARNNRKRIVINNRLLLGLLFLAALALRLYRPELMEFKHDEAVAWFKARAMLAGFEFPLTGLTSSKSLPNFPLFIYLIGLFQLLWREPQQLVYPIALLNSLGVFFVYHGARRLVNYRTALVAVLLYVISPSAIFYSRKIWAQDFLPFWSTALFCLAALIITRTRPRRAGRYWFLFGLLAVTSFQIHYSMLFLLAAYVPVFLLHRRRIKIWPMAAGTLVGLLPAIPLLIYLIERDASSFNKFKEQMTDAAALQLGKLPEYFAGQLTDIQYLAFNQSHYPQVADIGGYDGIRYLMFALVGLGLILCFCGLGRHGKMIKLYAKELLLLLFIPLIILGAIRVPLIPAYFILFYPLPFLLAALPIARGWQWLAKMASPQAGRIAGMTLCGIVLLYQLVFFFNIILQIGTLGGLPGDYGIAYNQTQEAGQWIARSETFTGPTLPIQLLEPFELATLAPLMDMDYADLAPLPDAPAGPAPGGKHNYIFIINRYKDPVLNPAVVPWVALFNEGYAVVKGPFEPVAGISQAYPNQMLTPVQHVEKQRMKEFAVEQLKQRLGKQ